MAYRVQIRPSAAREIRRIARESDRRRVVERIESLALDPRPPGCTKLSGDDVYRVRQGTYRVVYTIADTHLIVEVVKVGHRREVYR